MRRVLGLLLLLSTLTVTTAVASSFEVTAEDVTSFSTPVSISVPEPSYPNVLYLVNDHDLSTTFVEGLKGNVFRPGDFWEWESERLPDGLPVIDKLVDLYVYDPGGSNGTITARIYECPDVDGTATSGCVELDAATKPNPTNGENQIEFETIEGPLDEDYVRPGMRLRLRIANESAPGGPSFNIQWGKVDPGRESRLVFTESSTA